MEEKQIELLIDVLDGINNNLERISDSIEKISECVSRDTRGRNYIYVGGIMDTYAQ